jgi:2-dehydro-3-deoxyphosphogluconate aldolase/(4S)-4-hydroxy-2-oxoglutarate aldolase
LGGALDDAPVLAILRYPRADGLELALEALAAGGIRVAEVTSTTPGWLDSIAGARGSGLVVGGGTVTSAAMVRDVAAAGGSFVVSPGLDAEVVRESHRCGLEPLPGVLTGSEVLAARNLGVEYFKLFPVGSLGPDYLRQMRGPFPELSFLPTGGVTASTARAWMAAGARAVAVGADLSGKFGPRTSAETDDMIERARATLDAAGCVR